MAIEVVKWYDAHWSLDDTNHDEFYANETVGEVSETERWLRIAGEWTPDGERSVTYVHKSSVVKRTVLGPVGTESRRGRADAERKGEAVE